LTAAVIDAGDNLMEGVAQAVPAANAVKQDMSLGTATIPEGVAITMKGNVAVTSLVIKAGARLTIQGDLQFRPGNAGQLVMGPSASLTVNGDLACPSGTVASIDPTARVTILGNRSPGCPF
jgi:hypothetical protein